MEISTGDGAGLGPTPQPGTPSLSSVAPDDSALQALRALVKVLDANDERVSYVRTRAEQIESLAGQGYSWQQILSTEDRPLIIDVLDTMRRYFQKHMTEVLTTLKALDKSEKTRR